MPEWNSSAIFTALTTDFLDRCFAVGVNLIRGKRNLSLAGRAIGFMLTPYELNTDLKTSIGNRCKIRCSLHRCMVSSSRC